MQRRQNLSVDIHRTRPDRTCRSKDCRVHLIYEDKTRRRSLDNSQYVIRQDSLRESATTSLVVVDGVEGGG